MSNIINEKIKKKFNAAQIDAEEALFNELADTAETTLCEFTEEIIQKSISEGDLHHIDAPTIIDITSNILNIINLSIASGCFIVSLHNNKDSINKIKNDINSSGVPINDDDINRICNTIVDKFNTILGRNNQE